MLSFLSLLMVVAGYTAVVRLAAFLLRQTRLGWRDACIFSLILLIIGGLCMLLARVTGNTPVAGVAFAVGIAAQAGAGAWYLGPRARTAAGQPLGTKGGALLALIASGLITVIGGTLALGYFMLVASRL
jgi:hypothetical protein